MSPDPVSGPTPGHGLEPGLEPGLGHRLGTQTRAALDRRLATAQREGRLPSVVAGVVRGGTLAWTGAVGTLDGRRGGPAPDPDTQYRMGSITKTLVAVAVLRLRDDRRLDLTDRLEMHVPGSALGAATVEQLLSHASGAPAETPGPWWERVPGGDWESLTATALVPRFRAGRRFHYSNVGYAALGRLLEAVHGRGWFEVIQEGLLDPLGMTRTTTRPSERAAPGLAVHPFADVILPEPEHDAGAMAPAGQLWTTLTDLARWAAFLGGDTAGLLSSDTLGEMLEPHHVVDDPGEPWTMAHGLGWQVGNVDGVRYAGHGGSMPGFLAALRVRPDTGDGVVLMTNTTASPATRGLAADLLDALGELEPVAVEPWAASGGAAVVDGLDVLDQLDVLDVLGTWHWGPAVETARLDGEHLVLGEPGRGRGSRFAPVAEDRWVGLDGYHAGEPLRVVRHADRTVSHLDLGSFRFTRTPYDVTADVPGGVDEAGWR